MIRSLKISHLAILGVFFLVFFMAGCASEGDPKSLVVKGKTGQEVKLNGKWITDCSNDGDSWKEDLLAISGSEFTQTTDVWLAGSSCGGAAEVVVRGKGTFSLGEPVSVNFGSANAVATKVDIATASLTATPKNDVVAWALSQANFFGYTDWIAGEARDILGRDSQGNPVENTLEKNVITVDDGVVPNKLYFGDTSAVGTDGYPTALDVSNAYKQK